MPVRTVALNATFLEPGVSGGVETYLRGLAPALARRFENVRFVIATTRRGARALAREPWIDGVRLLALPSDTNHRAARLWAEQVRVPYLARARGWDVVHSLASVAPIRCPVPSVITLHDVTFFRHRTFGLLTTVAMQTVVSRAARNADFFVTGTAAARDEICDELGLDPAKFLVVYHGHDHRPVNAADPQEVSARYGLEGARVVLCVAAKRPHKNQEVLIRAMPALDSDVVLVLAGHAEPYDLRLREIAEAEGVADRVRFLGHVADEELDALYLMCSCFAFPSLAEGFGIPVIEAMQRGVPVAASDIPVLREVGGDAARYFDPHSPGDAAAQIGKTLIDGSLGAAGVARAARFTWDAAAEGTFEAYERAVHARA